MLQQDLAQRRSAKIPNNFIGILPLRLAAFPVIFATFLWLDSGLTGSFRMISPSI